MPLLEVQDLAVHFHLRGRIARAVDGVSFSVERGQTVGIVGESGSGKSVTCYSLLGLIPKPPGVIAGGKALFDGRIFWPWTRNPCAAPAANGFR
jgi:oligopeptide transport system ATP-binding protein